MNFDIQAPGFDFLVLVPAIIVVAAGLALRRPLGRWPAAFVAALLPGIVLLLLTIADEGIAEPGDLAHAPVGWGIWMMLSLPGTLLGLGILLALRWLRRRRRQRG
jgi:hypothetical protein